MCTFSDIPKMRKGRSLKGKKGSLLIEALLSVMILSVSMVIVIRSMSQSAQATAYSAEYFRSLFFLENKMSEIMGSPENYSSAAKSGQLPYPNDNYRYETVTSLLKELDFGNLREMTLDLSWDRGSAVRNLTLTTYLSIPESM